MLSSDPHVSVNESKPVPLTKQPAQFDVDTTEVEVVVTPFADSDRSGPRRRHFTALTSGRFSLTPGERLALRFHPAILNSSVMFRGHLWRKRR